MDYSPPDSSVHGISQARILEWEGKCHFLLQGIFPSPGSNPHLLRWQMDSSPLSHQGSQRDILALNKYSIPYQAFTLLLFTLVWVPGFLFCSIDFFIICCDAYIVSYFISGNPFKLAHLSFCPILLYFLFFWHNKMFPAHVVFSLPQCCKWPFPQGIGLPNIIEINKVNLHFR